MAEELKPCPFCGAPARTHNYNDTLQATCSSEFAECAGFDVGAPVAMWNRRASPPQPDALKLAESATEWAKAVNIAASEMTRANRAHDALKLAEFKLNDILRQSCGLTEAKDLAREALAAIRKEKP